MSKSLGNGIDPLLLIDEVGADALRFMLTTGNTPGNDMRFIKDKLEASRNFANITNGYGAHGTVEAVGTQESMWQAIKSTRPGGHVGYVGVSHGVELDGLRLFGSVVHLHGGPAPVRRFLPELIRLIWDGTIDPGKVFDLSLPLEEAAEAYKAMDERRATKVLLTF